jgi:hypothetical protein
LAADAYDEFFGPITHRLIAPVLDATGVTAGTRLHDIACGPDHLVAEAAARGAHQVGIDAAHAMIRQAETSHRSPTSGTGAGSAAHREMCRRRSHERSQRCLERSAETAEHQPTRNGTRRHAVDG